MSNIKRTIIYEDENKRNPMDVEQVFRNLETLTLDDVLKMSARKLSSYFPTYSSGEYRPLQHGGIWDKLYELERGIRERRDECIEYREKDRILSGIRWDGEHI